MKLPQWNLIVSSNALQIVYPLEKGFSDALWRKEERKKKYMIALAFLLD